MDWKQNKVLKPIQQFKRLIMSYYYHVQYAKYPTMAYCIQSHFAVSKLACFSGCHDPQSTVQWMIPLRYWQSAQRWQLIDKWDQTRETELCKIILIANNALKYVSYLLRCYHSITYLRKCKDLKKIYFSSKNPSRSILLCPCLLVLIVVLTALSLHTDKKCWNCLTTYYKANVCEIMLYLSLEALVGSGLLFEFFTEELAPSSDDMGRGRWPIPVGCCRPAACSSAAST